MSQLQQEYIIEKYKGDVEVDPEVLEIVKPIKQAKM
jgi:hypothetical protein